MFMSTPTSSNVGTWVIVDWFQCLDCPDVWTPERFMHADGYHSYLRKTSDDLTRNPKYDGNILIVHGKYSMCGGQLFVIQDGQLLPLTKEYLIGLALRDVDPNDIGSV